jgi:hypothetical protein
VALTGEPFEIAAGPSGVWITDFQHLTITQVRRQRLADAEEYAIPQKELWRTWTA